MSRKDSRWSGNTLSGKKVMGKAVGKEQVDSLLRYEKAKPFFEKSTTVNSASYIQILRYNLPYLLNDLRIFIDILELISSSSLFLHQNDLGHCTHLFFF